MLLPFLPYWSNANDFARGAGNAPVHRVFFANCSNYKGNRGTCTSTHYIRVDFLEQVVLGEIRRLTKFASKYEDEQSGLAEQIKTLRTELDRIPPLNVM